MATVMVTLTVTVRVVISLICQNNLGGFALVHTLKDVVAVRRMLVVSPLQTNNKKP